MKRTQLKDALRTIRSRFVSWLAMAVVAMMGCSIILGAYGYVDSMDSVADAFLDRTNYLDLRVSAVPGLNDKDIEALRDTDGVADVEGTYAFDAATLHVGDEDLDVRLLALTQRISVPEYVEGRAPAAQDEVALSLDIMDEHGIALGDKVELDLGSQMPDGFLRHKEFTVTGRVAHGDSLRNGWSPSAIVTPEAFETAMVQDLYSTAYIDVSLPEEANMSSDDYTRALQESWQAVEDTMAERAEARKDESVTLPDGTVVEAQDLGSVVISRDQMRGYLSYVSNTQVVRVVATLFAALFVVVSIVVTVSTITILVNGEMRLLGAMKALGFTDTHIVDKYLVFSLLSIAFGMVLAVPLAFVIELFEDNVMGVMFCCGRASMQVQVSNLALMTLVELVLSAAATCVATLRIVRSRPAVQLLAGGDGAGTSPLAGITAKRSGRSLYARLIVRNLVTDFARVLVSIVIVAASCLTIGMGLTMRSSFHGMVGRSAAEVTHYDLQVALDAADGTDELERLTRWFEGEGATCATLASTPALYRVGNTTDTLTLLVADDDVFRDFYELRSYEGDEALVPQTTGCVVSTRASELSGLQTGDVFSIFDGGLLPHELSVDGVARIYLGRSAFLSRECYEKVYGSAPQDNVVLARLEDGGEREELVRRLEKEFPSCTISYPDILPSLVAKNFQTVFDMLILLMLFLALLLSVFVLLNLANIYVHRRHYELTVMAINGFGQRQLVGYLLRETLATNGLGLALGVLVGCLANETLVRMAEVGDVMFVRELNPLTWLMAAAIEAAFATAVYLIAFRGIRNLDITDVTR